MQVVLAFAIMLALPALVQAQGVTTSSINGRVLDDVSGEALIGANVLAIHVPSGTAYGNSTDLDGFFRIPGMRVGGPYTVTISYTGYETATYENVYINLGQGANLDVKLRDAAIELGGVEIVANRSDLFSNDRTGASTQISSQTLETAPTISRSINDFTRLTPQSNGTSFGGRDNRFNNYSVDGNIYNNNFGLGSSQFAGGNPLSLDAIEQVQVSLAPYDVRQGGFSGANVNAVTRSGSNNWEGSAYVYYRNEKFTGNRIGETTFSVDDASTRIIGARLGGPIIKNKLFFFVSVEQEESSIPSFTKVASRPGLEPDGLNVSRVPADQLDFVMESMDRLYGYDTGEYENYNFANQGLRINARLDYNINQNHKVFVRYNNYSSFRDVGVNGNSLRYNPSALRYRNTNRFGIEAMNFRNSHYTVDNNVSSLVAELNSLFGNNMSNTLRVGFTAIEDPIRNVPGTPSQAFPFIEVLEFDGATPQYYMTMGNELFTVGNLLSNNIFNITDNFSIYRGRNEFTFGGNFEYMTFENAFNPVLNGLYRFNSYDNFVAAVIDQDPTVRPDLFLQGYSFEGPDDIPVDAVSFGQVGVFGQVKSEVASNLTLTLGLRVDMPFYPVDLPSNDKLDALNLEFVNPRTDEVIVPDVSVLPGVRPLIQPRFGFNYDVFDDNTLQIRGGTGTFSGRIPFVWISNQVNNNGVTRGGYGLTADQWGVDGNPTWDGFQPDVTYYRPDPETLEASVSQNLALTDVNLRLPMVWRSNLAADYKLPGGIVATLEGIYSRDLNGPLAVNINAKAPTIEQISDKYPYPIWEDGYYENEDFRDVILLTNINEGYYASGTIQLQRTFKDYATASFAYTRSVSKDYGLEGGSQAASLWPTTVVGDRNAPELSFSRFDQPNRIVSFVSLSNKYLQKQNSTSISIFYVGGEGGRFTYSYSDDDQFGDGASRPMYVPTSADEAFIIDRDIDGEITTAAAQWTALNDYIEQDPYLSTIRGSVSERNGAKLPWLHRFDLRFVQDVNLDLGGNARIQLTADILNVGNMINSEWGVAPTTVQRNLLNFEGLDGNGNPQFTVNNQSGTDNFPEVSFRPNININQTWSAQVGFRVIFE